MNKKTHLIPLLGLLLALAVLSGCSGDASSDGALSSFTASTLNGGVFTQDEIKAKDVTIVNFWGTFCGPCRAEMPDLAAYAKALPENVQLITVCLDISDESKAADAKAILSSAGYDGETLLPGEDDAFLSLCQSIQAVPTTIFVDGAGNITGDPVIGSQPDLAASFTAKVNEVLKASGKVEISIGG